MPERWWSGDASETFWLEITDREDLGLDLNAPTASEEGEEYWSYTFVREVRDGDVVLHYRARPNRSITHWSRATGAPYPDEVFWGAHGQAGGRGPVAPYWRPGWRRPLDGPYELPKPVDHLQLQDHEGAIRGIRDQLRAQHPDIPLYFPFQLSDARPLRAFQGYLAKFPRVLVELIPQLRDVEELAANTRPSAATPSPAVARPTLGGDYRWANPDVRTARREPFSVDPDRVDRALHAHARTQDALAEALIATGKTPRSPVPGEPAFDLSWEDGGAIWVAEVKSLSASNEEKQLRLALGQVIRYAHLLGAKGRPVRRMIVAERAPSDPSWVSLCADLGITLTWPPELALEALAS